MTIREIKLDKATRIVKIYSHICSEKIDYEQTFGMKLSFFRWVIGVCYKLKGVMRD